MPLLLSLIQYAIGLVILAAVITWLVFDAKDEFERLQSAGGVLAFILIGFIGSAHPAHVRWRHIFWGLGIQFSFGLLVLRWDVGQNIFKCIGDKVVSFLTFTDAGSSFVYGYLVTGNVTGTEDSPIANTVFMFKVLFRVIIVRENYKSFVVDLIDEIGFGLFCLL